MIAQFWRQGKFVRVPCRDVSVAITPYYAEIILKTDEHTEDLLFVVSDDPDIEANMTTNGQCCAYDGFLLRDHDGSTIEKITTADVKTLQ